MINLFKMFRSFGLDDSVEVKMYRHAGHGDTNIEELYSRGVLESYSYAHGKHILGKGYVAIFIGEENRLSRFVSLRRIDSRSSGDTISKIQPHREDMQYVEDSYYWYKMEKDTQFTALKDRLVIRWPKGQLAHRWLVRPDGKIKNIEIHSIRAIGFSNTFPGFDELIISNADLATLVRLGDGGAGWIEALRSTRGIYLITDTVSGELYVGSATGADGIWGRWRDYGKKGHGENLVLKKRCESDPDYKKGLQYSILETLGNLATKNEGLEAERLWKRKFGNKATMLNAN